MPPAGVAMRLVMSWLLLVRGAAQETEGDNASFAHSTAASANVSRSLQRFNISGAELCETSALFNRSVAGECLQLRPCCDWRDGLCVSTFVEGTCSVVCDQDGGGCAVEEMSGWSVGAMVAVGLGSACWCCVFAVQSVKWLRSEEDEDGQGTKQACVLLLLLLLLLLPWLVQLDEKLALLTGLSISPLFEFDAPNATQSLLHEEMSEWSVGAMVAVGVGSVCVCCACLRLAMMALRRWQAQEEGRRRDRRQAQLVSRDSRDSSAP